MLYLGIMYFGLIYDNLLTLYFKGDRWLWPYLGHIYPLKIKNTLYKIFEKMFNLQI